MPTSTASPNPTGGDAAAASAHRASKPDEADIDTAVLLDAVLASDNLRRAWRRVKANKGAPGIDGVSIEAWPEHARAYWPDIREQIIQGRYCPLLPAVWIRFLRFSGDRDRRIRDRDRSEVPIEFRLPAGRSYAALDC